jgi:hypothetical protein
MCAAVGGIASVWAATEQQQDENADPAHVHDSAHASAHASAQVSNKAPQTSQPTSRSATPPVHPPLHPTEADSTQLHANQHGHHDNESVMSDVTTGTAPPAGKTGLRRASLNALLGLTAGHSAPERKPSISSVDSKDLSDSKKKIPRKSLLPDPAASAYNGGNVAVSCVCCVCCTAGVDYVSCWPCRRRCGWRSPPQLPPAVPLFLSRRRT